MTIAELLIALTITALVGTTATAMLFATVNATDERNDFRHVNVRTAVVKDRLADEIRASLAFLAVGANELVLWSSDGNENGAVNLDELVLIERDPGSNELRRYAVDWPAGWDQATIDAANTAYLPSADFSAAATLAKGAGYFPAAVWSTEVTAMTVTLDAATPQPARLATITLTISAGDLSDESVVAAALRDAQTPASE